MRGNFLCAAAVAVVISLFMATGAHAQTCISTPGGHLAGVTGNTFSSSIILHNLEARTYSPNNGEDHIEVIIHDWPAGGTKTKLCIEATRSITWYKALKETTTSGTGTITNLASTQDDAHGPECFETQLTGHSTGHCLYLVKAKALGHHVDYYGVDLFTERHSGKHITFKWKKD